VNQTPSISLPLFLSNRFGLHPPCDCVCSFGHHFLRSLRKLPDFCSSGLLVHYHSRVPFKADVAMIPRVKYPMRRSARPRCVVPEFGSFSLKYLSSLRGPLRQPLVSLLLLPDLSITMQCCWPCDVPSLSTAFGQLQCFASALSVELFTGPLSLCECTLGIFTFYNAFPSSYVCPPNFPVLPLPLVSTPFLSMLPDPATAHS